MKVVLQRVNKASVCVEEEVCGSIGKGLLLLIGIHQDDTEEHVEWMCDKSLNLRIFDDEEGKMNRSVRDVQGELLLVSQFTLYGDARKGHRPSYSRAAGPQKAERLYEHMINYMKENTDLKIETGRFGAYMKVDLQNDGPVTIIIEK